MNPDAKTILIADDEEQSCFCLSLALKMSGFNAVVANDGEKALQTILERHNTAAPIAVLVCDIQMPNMSGEELVEKLNSLKIAIPTLVITGFGEKNLVIRLMRQGCRDFIDKPLDPSYIVDRIKLILAEGEDALLETRRTEGLARIGIRTKQAIHDVNNIMCGALAYAQSAQKSLAAGHPAKGHMDKVVHTTQRAADICRTLMAASRRPDFPELVPVEITGLLARIGKILADILDPAIALEIKTGPEPLWCNANAERLQQALLNLGFNAADAMPQGGRLAVECSRNGSHIRIAVTDTGTGIPEADRNRIFDYGYTTKNTGHGIGLSTVKEIVQEHGGIINLLSEPGKGATFFLRIPEIIAPNNHPF